MEFKEGSNAGQDNIYNENNLGDNSQYIHQAEKVTIINNGPRSARIAKDYAPTVSSSIIELSLLIDIV